MSIPGRMAYSTNGDGLCILVVGDGDFSGSLAIRRAYRSHIRRLVATSLVSCRKNLVALYPMAKTTLEELEAAVYGVPATTILFGVDATRLHLDPQVKAYGPFDYIIFQHPHIGHKERSDVTAVATSVAHITTTNPDHDLSITQKRPSYEIMASQHAALLAHYLYSSRELLRNTAHVENGRQSWIHLCLCAGQSKSWRLQQHLRRLGLEYADRPTFASKPLWSHLAEESLTSTSGMIGPEEDHDHHGGGGCYWLSRYGYQHQATYPSTTQLKDRVNSHHHFFRLQQPRTDTGSSRSSSIIGKGGVLSTIPSLEQEGDDSMTRKNAKRCAICLQEECMYSHPF